MLSELIQRFNKLRDELIVAVRSGDESSVGKIDPLLLVLKRRIFAFQARNRFEIAAQQKFFADLASKSCGDEESVSRYTGMMMKLFDRYLDADSRRSRAASDSEGHALPHGYDASLHELLLDSVPERVAVIGLDYRYLYTNQCNAEFHMKRPSDFIGKHLLDMIDSERFHDRARPRLDQCFGGARVIYRYEAADASGRMFEVTCRMTPFVGPNGNVAGAVLVLSMAPMFARVN